MSARPRTRADELARFRGGITGYLAVLVVQLWIGVWVNLFVTVPEHHPGANPPEYFSGVVRSVTWAITQGPSPWLSVHAVLGLILVLGAFGQLGRAIAFRSRGLIIAFAVGAFGVLAAGFNGGSFLNYHQDFSSMLMASGFSVAILAWVAALALTARPAAAG